MNNRNLSLDALKSHLFETLEGVKNLSDPMASENEKISIDQAKQIVDVSGKIIDIYKVQVEAIKTFSSMDDVASVRTLATGIGVASDETVSQIEG
ncbi:MAG: hypothetical protein K6E35_07855 [Bacteroidales bacterium]|nr:hypothetical protein [Bacteroidales bacterium]